MAIAFLVMKISRRLSRVLVAGAVICSPSLAFAQDTVLFFGGVQSCTVWQCSPRNQLAGQTWILALFLAGTTRESAERWKLHKHLRKIIGEVKKICTAQQSYTMHNATEGSLWDYPPERGQEPLAEIVSLERTLRPISMA